MKATTIAAIAGSISAAVTFLSFARQWYKDKKTYKEQFGNRDGEEVFDTETIKRATRCYIRPDCSNVDPNQEAEIRLAHMTKEPLFANVDRFLAKDHYGRHLLVLADSGMGKTAFTLNYYVYNQRRPKRKRHRIVVVPLGVKDPEKLIDAVSSPQEVCLFLDALDEDQLAVIDHRERVRILMDCCEKFRRVLITCRTQFFLRDEEIPKETGVLKLGPRKPGESGEYEFWKIYLCSFDDYKIKHFLRKRYAFFQLGKRRKAEEIVKKIPTLSIRPMILTYIPDLIEEERAINTMTDLYAIIVDAWLDREKRWVPEKEDLYAFSKNLAMDIYLKKPERGREALAGEDIQSLADGWGIRLEGWQMTGRSLLNRDAGGNFKFAHRSIMEYLFVLGFLELEPSDRPGDEWTDLMKAFVLELAETDADLNLTRVDLAWQNLRERDFSKRVFFEANFHRATLRGASFKNADLRNANLQNTDMAKANLQNAKLQGCNLDGTKFIVAEPDRWVRLEPEKGKGFWIGCFPVTNEEFEWFMNAGGYANRKYWSEEGWQLKEKGKWQGPGDWGNSEYNGKKQPVVGVSWYEAVAYCRWLTEHTDF